MSGRGGASRGRGGSAGPPRRGGGESLGALAAAFSHRLAAKLLATAGGGRGGGAGRGGRTDGGGLGASRGGGGRGAAASPGGGGGRGAQSGGRGGGGPKGPESVNEVLTNVVEAAVAESFDFYLIGLDGQDKTGNQIDSPSRRAFLFVFGLQQLLKDLPEAELAFYIRMSFVQGSTAFCGRVIPGLQEKMVLCDGTDTHGDTLTIASIERLTIPECLKPPADATTPAAAGGVRFDQFRCQGCARTFPTVADLQQHCHDAGQSHAPIVIRDDEEEAKPAETAVFLAYVNCALQRAMGDTLTRWGQDYVNPEDCREVDGVKIFEAVHLSFSLGRIAANKVPSLLLTCDLKAKLMRCRSLLDELNELHDGTFPSHKIAAANRKYVNNTNSVIYNVDRKRYNVVALHFDKSPDTLLLSDKKLSHTEYFKSKGVMLEFPRCPPMVEVKGRRDKSMFFPPELVFEDELDDRIRRKLPQLTSFDPPRRHAAISKALKGLSPAQIVLTPATQKSSGGSILPALGVVLKDSRVKLKATPLPFPTLIAADRFGKNDFKLTQASFNVDPSQATTLNVVLFYNERILHYLLVYEKIRDFINGMNKKYRFPPQPYAQIRTSSAAQHFGAVGKYFADAVPDNVFVLDFTNPQGSSGDVAYPVIKHSLGQRGYLSQFVNWRTCRHDDPNVDERKSAPILQGVSRQIIQKTGVSFVVSSDARKWLTVRPTQVCLWYVSLPKEVPMPAMFLGIDVFHAPHVYDPKTKKKGRKCSVVAFVFSLIEKTPQQGQPIVTRTYAKTFRRDPGEEFNLSDLLHKSVQEAVHAIAIQPAAVFVYRDGMNESSVSHERAEIDGIRRGLTIGPVGGQQSKIPLAYVNCQKRMANKFLTVDGQFAAPAGTMITGLQGLHSKTFYVNNTAPKGSTAKPTRYELVYRDVPLRQVPIELLTYIMCYTYPNWTGLIKVPGPVQCAHKAAELAGCMVDGGDSINAKAYTNTCYYL